MSSKSTLLAALLALLLPAQASAQIAHGGTPPGMDPELAGLLAPAIPAALMPAFDVGALLVEDERNAGRKDIPWRFGHNIPVDLGIEADGAWEDLPDGKRVWRLAVRSPGAFSINLAFDRFDLPTGAKLFVRNADGTTVLGAFTEENNQADGVLATTLVPGDEVVLEYLLPSSATWPGDLHLARVTHAYKDVFSDGRDLNDSGACNNNVHCPPLTDGWQDQVRAVVMLVVGGNGFCTGSMLNNTAQDGTPYLLTANHCYSNPSSWVAWFGWESPDCDNPAVSPSFESISGMTLRARESSSDFALLELSSSPPQDWNVYLAGWDKSGVTPTSVTCIHHPSGDIKKFTVEGSQVMPSGSLWEVGPWDDGTTEGGSSGSPLYDQDHRAIGQLYGGTAACSGSNPNNGTDVYGRFDLSWDGAAAGERLRDWLDPLGQDPDYIDGLDLGIPPPPYDAGISGIALPDPDAWYCDPEVPAEVTLTNFGSETLASAQVDYRIDSSAWQAFAWTGTLAPGSSVQVALPPLSVAGAGSHGFSASASLPGGQPDGNPANDGLSSNFEILGAQGSGLPLAWGFEDASFPPAGWDVLDPDTAVAWARTDEAGGWGASTASAWFDNFEDDHTGQADSLVTPLLDLGSAAGPLLLDFSLAYTRYDEQHADRLQVAVTSDCGQTWQVAWDQESEALMTTPDQHDAFVPTGSEWRGESVSLDTWAGQPGVRVAFVNITGWGNNLYVDDVVIHGGPSAEDADGDGYTEEAGDCDDSDAAVHPGQQEVCDGVDTDCDGSADDVDADGDGALAQECGGPDCDDSDPDIGPDAAEDCGNGIDDDCDGAIDGADADCAGDDDAGDDDAGDDDAGDDDEADDDVSPSGFLGSGTACACEAGGRGTPGVAAGLLLLVALRRRRR